MFAEELENHRHGEIRDLTVSKNFIWIDDGIFYPIRIRPTVRDNQNGHHDKETVYITLH
jgi:hypothetical protein